MHTKLKTLLLAGLSAAASLGASASVIQTIGAGSAVTYVQHAADFEANTSLANNYSEGGLLFSFSGAGNNSDCGYAGVNCVEPGDAYSAAFSGNYMATSGLNAYVSIRSTLRDLAAIEFAVDSGYNTIFGLWRVYNDAVLTGSGNFNLGPAGIGGVLGLADSAGFDEVRFYAFGAANLQSDFSAPAIDSVRAFAVPEPGSLVLATLALVALLGVGRKR